MVSNARNENVVNTKPKFDHLAVHGAWYGIKAGLALSLTYAVIGSIIIDLVEKQFPLFILMLIIGSPMVLLLAIAPSFFYGLFTGLILGTLVERIGRRIPQYGFVVLCGIVCLSIATLSHLILRIHPTLSFDSLLTGYPSYMSLEPYDSYPFWIGIPSLIYVATGGWVGWKLYSDMLIKMDQTMK